MSKSSIEWTTETWNPVVGCSILTPGCSHCYAMGMAARIEAINAALVADGKPMQSPQYAGTTRKVNGHAVWTGRLALAGDNILLQPLKRRKPTTYFVNSMGDLFHEDVPDEWIDKVFAVMALAPQHIFQVLTKRAARMREYFLKEVERSGMINCSRADRIGDVMLIHHNIENGFKCVSWPLPNVWLGVSTERQQEADERIPLLLQTPAAVRFISAEPLLGPIDLNRIHEGFDTPEGARVDMWESCLNGKRYDMWAGDDEDPMQPGHPKLDWVIVGGESGPEARPMHPDWARSLKVQCEAAGVPFFFKQWGSFRPLTDVEKVTACGATLVYPDAETQRGPQNGAYMLPVGKKAAGRSLDGIEYNEMPEVVR